MKIRVENEQQLFDLAEELLRITTNLRHYTKLWEESYGVVLRDRKKCWEDKADKLIATLQVSKLNRNETFKIEIDETNKTIL
jgi:hypothetical protein